MKTLQEIAFLVEIKANVITYLRKITLFLLSLPYSYWTGKGEKYCLYGRTPNNIKFNVSKLKYTNIQLYKTRLIEFLFKPFYICIYIFCCLLFFYCCI